MQLLTTEALSVWGLTPWPQKKYKSPHSATELKADSGFLLRLRHGVALQVPELGVVPSVPRQKSNCHLGEQKDNQNKSSLEVTRQPRRAVGTIHSCHVFLFLKARLQHAVLFEFFVVML